MIVTWLCRESHENETRAIARIQTDRPSFNCNGAAMQMTEDLIRNVVQEVLSQMGGGCLPANGKAPSRRSGNLGVFSTRGRRRASGRSRLSSVPEPAGLGSQEGGRVHPEHLRQPG